MDILQEVQTFINSKDFWIYHGFVLSGMWVFLSALAILLKKVNTQLHVLLFILIDAITVFFAGAALWRVSASFHLFNEWPLLKKAHVCAGSLFLVLVIVQHIGGMTAFLGKKSNPQHRSFGKILVIIGRIIAGVGWLLGGNQKFAIIVAVVSLIMLGLSLVIDTKPVESSSKSESIKGGERSKSPRAKRE